METEKLPLGNYNHRNNRFKQESSIDAKTSECEV